MERFTRRQGVLQRLLGIVGRLPFDMQEEVQPSIEVRALRFWEEVDERIQRWSSDAFAALLAGNFSSLSVPYQPNAAVPLPRGALITIDRLVNRSGQTVLGAIAQPVTNNGTVVPVFTDSRIAPASAPTPHVIKLGTQVAAFGATIFSMGDNTQYDPELTFEVGRDGAIVNNGDCLLLGGSLVATAVRCVVKGRIILP